MNVLIVNNLFRPYSVGGAEESVYELANELASQGLTVTVATAVPPDYSGPLSEALAGGVQVERWVTNSLAPFLPQTKRRSAFEKLYWHLAEIYRPSAYRFLSRLIRDTKPDIVHLNNTAGFGGAAWRACRGVKSIQTERGYYLACWRSTTFRDSAPCSHQCQLCHISKLPLRAARHRPDMFVGISSAMLERNRQFGAIKAGEPTAVVQNAPHQDPVPVTPHNGFVIGMMGQTDPKKGFDVVLNALATVPDLEVTLIVAGDGLPQFVEPLALLAAKDPRVTLTGRLSRDEFFAQVDAVLVPSQWPEPFGRVAAEAILAGRNVAVSGAGGLPEAVAGKPGSIIVDDFDSPQAWATAIEVLSITSRADTGTSCDTTRRQVSDVASEYRVLYESLAHGSMWSSPR
ncbi:MAG: glycosyltransferase [Propionibacteriaceae bacterium]|jgi:glycosyltransferase involved in cell wall biosynthesis|nr:glycosyltransferase [Propionibacteriaceae bacterium]